MVTRRGLRACFALGAFLMVVATGGAPSAAGATTSLEWDPPAYDFGPVPYASGPSAPHEFTLTNTGETQLVTHWRSAWTSAWPEASDPFWTPTPSACHILEPEESCSIEFVFDPLHPGHWRGWEKVRGQDESEPWTELELSGDGAGPLVPMTPERLVFESVAVGMTTKPQTVTLESQDREEFRIEGISFVPEGESYLLPTPFQVVGDSCHEGQSLAPGKTCTIEVVMAPTVSGPFQSRLVIADTAPGSPQSVELEGTATPAPAGQPVALPPTAGPHARPKRACPKGKRKIVKKGRRTCVKRHRHHRHRVHAAR
jgi:centrosomal CEP192-like protein